MPTESSRRTRTKTLGASALLLAVGFVFFPEQDVRSGDSPSSSREASENTRALASEADPPKPAVRKSRKRSQRRDPRLWLAEVLARNPGLEPEWRYISDHENGFLQWLEFCEKHQVNGDIGTEKLDIPAEIAEILSDPKKWDREVMETFLAGSQRLIETITRIGLLPSQSVKGIDLDRWSFVGARFTKQSAEILMADARLAAESGDFERALRRVRAASGLADNYDQVEAPSLLMATVSTLVRLSVQDQVMNYVLPSLDLSSGEIARLRVAIRPPVMAPSGFSQILRGEAWVGLGAYVIPALNGDSPSISIRELPDPDVMLDHYAQSYISATKRAETFSLEDFIGGEASQPLFPLETGHLSKEAEGLLDMIAIGATAWGKGWVRAMVISARADAALAILQGEEIPLEPFSGLPYIYDPEARTLHVPDDPLLRGEEMNIGAPLQLP